MKNIIQKRFLFTLAWTLTFSQSAMSHKSMFEEIKNGICPDGLEYSCSILAGGCAALPGAMIHAALQNKFSEIPNTLSCGVPALSATAAAYTFYKAHKALAGRTKQAILQKKASVLEEIKELEEYGLLTKKSIIAKLKTMFTDQAAQGACLSILINSYLEHLIKEIKWLNPKLIFLGENPIDQRIIKTLEKTRTKIVASPDYGLQRNMHRKYEKELYENQLSTKLKHGAWWTTKKTAQAGFFAAKVGVYVCWDLFKIILSNITRTIV
ncbi:hypothetical protein EKK58_01560 [Candidatus Dependentiae bacterium]|nr:MAG: hypothetical protein EKK58_01560 [Candidatus Dependentiae bacterium]